MDGAWQQLTLIPNPATKKNSIQETKIQGRKNTTQQQDDRLNKALNDQTKHSHYGGWSMTKINPNSKPCNKKLDTRDQNSEEKEKQCSGKMTDQIRLWRTRLTNLLREEREREWRRWKPWCDGVVATAAASRQLKDTADLVSFLLPYIPTYSPTFLATYPLISLPTYSLDHLPTYLPTYLSTFLPTHQPLPYHVNVYQYIKYKIWFRFKFLSIIWFRFWFRITNNYDFLYFLY